MSENEGTIFSRHTARSDGTMGLGGGEGGSEQYPSLTEQGVERAQELARTEFTKMIEEADPSTVMFLGGASEEVRTKQTGDVIGNSLAEHFRDREDIAVITRADIEQLRIRTKEAEGGRVLPELQRLLDENQGKKVVVTYPLAIKQFGLRPHHREKETGAHTPYIQALLARTGRDENKAVLEWFRNKGKIEKEGKVLEVPSPQQTAEAHVEGINRLRTFTTRFAKDRPVLVGLVGHGWQLDALAVYLANKGRANVTGFKKLFGGKALKQPEAGTVTVSQQGATFSYRGKDYDVPPTLLEMTDEP